MRAIPHLHSHRVPGAGAFLAALTLCIATPAMSRAPATPRSPSAPRALDLARRVDINRIGMVVANNGSFAYDMQIGNAGLEYPRGSGHTAVFASGLWLGSGSRVALAEYSMEYQPGVILPGGAPDDPNRPEYVVYKVLPYRGVAQDTAHVVDGTTPDPLRHHSWSEYMTGAARFGAPWKLYRLPVTATPNPTDSVDVPGPDVIGDQMLWCVYNDANPATHTNVTGSTLPLGVEVQQSVFAFNQPGPLENTVFVRFKIINKGALSHTAMYASAWSDPDLGGFTDDLVGVDVGRGLGFTYNSTNADEQYGAQVPAVGYDLLRGPDVSGSPLGLTSFDKYVGGGGPFDALSTLNLMRGLDTNGNPVIDPVSGLPTNYMVPGDPVAGTGWLDAFPSDRRMMGNTGPFALAPGQTQTLWLAIVAGQGSNRLASIQVMRRHDDYVQSFFDLGFPSPPPPPPAVTDCLLPGPNCPRSLEFWREECLAGPNGRLGLDQMQTIAAGVSTSYALFDWPQGSELLHFCELVLSPATDLRTRALQSFAALAATKVAQDQLIVDSGDKCFRLDPSTPITCADTSVHALEQLTTPTDSTFRAIAEYRDLDPTHPVPVEGAFFQPNFGTSLGYESFGGTVGADPDSFPVVELRFNGTQKGHRYLRQEGSPNVLYGYGGYFDVPFTAWDVTHGVQLDVGFLERALANSDGTYSPDTSTIATFDRTWGPSDETNGGRERLFIFSRPYRGSPRDELRVDGVVLNSASPLLYEVFLRRLDPTSAFDPADRFVITPGFVRSGGPDLTLWELEGHSLSDPAVNAAYQRVMDCVVPVTLGVGIGPTCDVPVVAVAATVDAEATPDRVHVRWFVPGGFAGTIERRVAEAAWSIQGPAVSDDASFVTLDDRQVEPGLQYGYRLRWTERGAVRFAGETTVLVPRVLALSLAGFRPNPAGATPQVAFTLPARGPVRLEVLDVAGRRRFARDLGMLAPGAHLVRLDGAEGMPAGIYFMRLSQAGSSVVARGVMMR